jgi:hypothetical protein
MKVTITDAAGPDLEAVPARQIGVGQIGVGQIGVRA